MPWYGRVLLILLLCGATGCVRDVALQSAASPPAPGLQDGRYVGVSDLPTPQLIRVAVGISQGRIVTIHLLQHPEWRAPAEQEELLRLVVASQTTEGHVPLGIDNEKEQLLQAIDDALTKARPAPPATP